MAKGTMNFAQQNTEGAVQATNWMRAIAEQNLNQSKAAFEGLLTIARNAVRGVDQQASAICEHSMQFAEETLSNTFDFAHKLVRMKEPQEFAQIQTEFVSRQAQVLGDQTKELGERIMQGVDDAAAMTCSPLSPNGTPRWRTLRRIAELVAGLDFAEPCSLLSWAA
jgi:hypothetical protein